MQISANRMQYTKRLQHSLRRLSGRSLIPKSQPDENTAPCNAMQHDIRKRCVRNFGDAPAHAGPRNRVEPTSDYETKPIDPLFSIRAQCGSTNFADDRLAVRPIEPMRTSKRNATQCNAKTVFSRRRSRAAALPPPRFPGGRAKIGFVDFASNSK